MFFFRTMAVVIGTAFLLYIQCTMNTINEGNGSGVGTGLVSGMLYEPDGTTPAKGASVVVRYKDKTASVAASGIPKTAEALYTTFTNSDGVFSFDTIADGLYVIEGSDDRGNMALYDSVSIANPVAPLTLHDDTLEPAGVITGTISLAESGNYLQVFVLAFGVDRFSQVQDDGTFLFSGFARGTYTLKILSLDPDYESVDTAGIVVGSGDTTDIGTVELPKQQQQPVPEAVEVDLDSALLRATISWQPTPDSCTAGYNIYRDSFRNGIVQSSLSLRLNGEQLYKDTVLVDNTLRNAIGSYQIDDSVHYSVTMVDKSGNESPRSTPVTLKVVTDWECYDTVALAFLDQQHVTITAAGDDEVNLLSDGNRMVDSLNSPRFYHISTNGTLLWSWQFPDGIPDTYRCPLIKGLYGNNIWLLCNLTENTTDFSTRYDSVFVYSLSSSGEFNRYLRIEPAEGNESTDQGGVIVNGNLYYRIGMYKIMKIDMETKITSPFFERDTASTRITGIVPDFNGGFIINVLTIDRSNLPGLFTEHECIIFDTDGIMSKTITLPLIYNSNGTDDKGYLIAADDTTLYFENYYFRLHPDGSSVCRAMPVHRFSNSVSVRKDGTVLIIQNQFSSPRLEFYRLKNTTRTEQ